MKKCWECEVIGLPIHNHHPVPEVRGGTKTIPLCESCHGKAHHRNKNMSTSALVKEGYRKKKAADPNWGGHMRKAGRRIRPLGLAVRKANAKKHNDRIVSIYEELCAAGYTTITYLVEKLNEIGVMNRQGRPYTYTNAYRIIKRRE